MSTRTSSRMPLRAWNACRRRSTGKRYYHPTDRGVEKRIAERLQEVRKAREAARDPGKNSE